MANTSLVSTATTQTITTVADYTRLTGAYGLPYARSIPLLIQLTGMKPSTTLHSFIDNTNIDANIYPSQQLTITGVVGKFLGADDLSAPNAWTVLRDWDTTDSQGNLQQLYPNGYWAHCNMITVGEIVRHYVTPTQFYAGICIARQVTTNPSTHVQSTVLHVSLVRLYNTATAYTDNVTSWSWATWPTSTSIRGDSSGATGTVSAVAAPTTIVTNMLGNWYGLYLIPAGSIKTGDHDISFTDDPTNGTNGVTSSHATFQSYGELDVYTRQIVQRVDTFVTNTLEYLNWWDPLAETFTIPADKKHGCFVTSVDLYFAVKNANETQPVIVQITDTVNGYPGSSILFNAVAQLSPADIVASTTASTPTRFRFKGPVFLEPGKEYALKVLTNSTAYKLWISQLGDTMLNDPTKSVSQQPYLGVLFKSQNNSTWTPDQSQDLMFNLYYAKFDTSKSGLVTMQNQSNPDALAHLPSNPFTVANGQTVCKVHFPDHGLFVGGYVDLSGSGYTATNGRFIVTKVITTDEFLITLGAAATFNGQTGGQSVTATKSIRYDALHVDIGSDYSLRAGTSMKATVLQSGTNAKDTVTVVANQNGGVQSTTRYVHSDINESLILGGKKSLDVNLNIYSSSSDLSPIINRNTLAAIMVSNKINSPSTADNTLVDNNTIVSAQASVTFTTITNIIGIPVAVDINHFKIGSYITISGTVSNNITTQILSIDKTTSPYQVLVSSALTSETPATTTIVQAEGYISDIAPIGGTSDSKYQTQRLVLSNVATGMQINFSAFIPPAADIQVYYRTSTLTGKSLGDVKWTAVPMSYKKSQGVEFLDQQYTINALSDFNVAQWKIVMTSTDTTRVPIIKGFTSICLA